MNHYERNYRKRTPENRWSRLLAEVSILNHMDSIKILQYTTVWLSCNKIHLQRVIQPPLPVNVFFSRFKINNKGRLVSFSYLILLSFFVSDEMLFRESRRKVVAILMQYVSGNIDFQNLDAYQILGRHPASTATLLTSQLED